jgi:hypothetical protein
MDMYFSLFFEARLDALLGERFESYKDSEELPIGDI